MFSYYFILLRRLGIFLQCTLFCLVSSFSSAIVGLLIAAQVSSSICRWFWECLLRLFVAIGVVVVVYPILPYSIFKTIANVKKKLISFRLCVASPYFIIFFLWIHHILNFLLHFHIRLMLNYVSVCPSVYRSAFWGDVITCSISLFVFNQQV